MKAKKQGAIPCTNQQMYFPVEVRDEEMWSNKEYSKRVVGIIDGKEKLLNQCSNIYELVPNSDIFPRIESVLASNNIVYNVSYTHIGHVRFYVNYNITDKRYAYHMKGTSDLVYPKITVTHSYNGKVNYVIVFGYFRLVCTNGLTIPVEEMSRFNLKIVGKHTEQIRKSFDKLDELLKFFTAEASLVIGAITDKYEVLGGHWVEKPEDRILEVLKAAHITAVENKKFNTVQDITARIMVEANDLTLGYNGKVNDWLIYNGINQYLYDDTRNIAAPEKRMETDQKVLEIMLA